MKPFRVSDAYLDWAHSSAAEDGQPFAGREREVQPVNDRALADAGQLHIGHQVRCNRIRNQVADSLFFIQRVGDARYLAVVVHADHQPPTR